MNGLRPLDGPARLQIDPLNLTVLNVASLVMFLFSFYPSPPLSKLTDSFVATGC